MSQPDSDTDIEKRESAAQTGSKKVPHGKPRLKLPSTGEGKSHWPTYAALALAAIALAVAIVAWFRTANSPSFSDQQTADAKKSTCTAYTSVREGVVTNTHMTSRDPVGQLAVAANARLALLGGGQYLRERLAAAPATPADLANAVTSMANTIEDLGIGYLSGATSIAQDPLRHDLDSQIKQINQLCT